MSTGTYRKGKISPAKAQELREARSAELKSLRESLEQFEATSDPAYIAATLALHDGYSPRNAMLIAMQKPTATDVAGFGEWKDRGRHVRKGEHGIRIMAPAGKYAVKGSDEAPADSPEGKDKEFMRFRAVSVFDISQTDPSPEAGTAEATDVATDEPAMALL
jgi:hypothetical protein